MATQYQINVFIEAPPRIEDLLRETHRTLLGQGAVLDSPPQVLLDDFDQDEPIEPEPVEGIDDAIERLSAWPALGTLKYVLSKLVLTVGFTHIDQNTLLVWVAFHGHAFKNDPSRLSRIVGLTHALHAKLNAMRSSFDWGLDLTFDDAAVSEQLIAGYLLGEPWLDLARREFVTENRIARLNSMRGSQSLLERTDNGGLVWQRDAGPP